MTWQSAVTVGAQNPADGGDFGRFWRRLPILANSPILPDIRLTQSFPLPITDCVSGR